MNEIEGEIMRDIGWTEQTNFLGDILFEKEKSGRLMLNRFAPN